MSLRPPSGGTPPPAFAELAGEHLDLALLAREVCARYGEHYADEEARYGRAGVDWCRHDNQWLLSWAAGDVLGVTDLDEQALWLARVLSSRNFPIERLAHNLRLAGDVVLEHVAPQQAGALDAALRRAALAVEAAAAS
jgi:hypothetical protein